jgi:hypothetical protein
MKRVRRNRQPRAFDPARRCSWLLYAILNALPSAAASRNTQGRNRPRKPTSDSLKRIKSEQAMRERLVKEWSTFAPTDKAN